MKRAELLEWYERLLEQRQQVPRDRRRQLDYEETAASAWLTEAEAALAAVFPPGHPTRKNWAAVFENARALNIQARGFRDTFHACAGVFEAASAILRSGRLGSLVDGIRIEAVAELLEQARRLHERGHSAAAIVTAGAALQNHLLHLCRNNDIQVPSDESIAALDDALSEAREHGEEVYSATDSRLVRGWGELHTAAAEHPGENQPQAGEIAATIEGIRQFVARVS